MLLLLSILSLLPFAPPRPVPPQKASLRVEVQNVRVLTGSVHLALFRSGKDFPKGKPVETKKLTAGSKSVQIQFAVEPGDYAIAVYHDENGNGKMDKQIFGIPKEPYGFSNDIKPVMSAPKFSECQFTVSKDGKAISIKLI